MLEFAGHGGLQIADNWKWWESLQAKLSVDDNFL
jgi:hypothetical protein